MISQVKICKERLQSRDLLNILKMKMEISKNFRCYLMIHMAFPFFIETIIDEVGVIDTNF